jgi:hypothetical protein
VGAGVITAKVQQEFAANDRAKKTALPAAKTSKKAYRRPSILLPSSGSRSPFLLACFRIPSEKNGHNQYVRSLG